MSADPESPVRLEEVSFYYPETTALVFNRLSLQLPPGVTTLVGQNGTGKSTLLLLAAGVLLPVEGTITILGHDTRTLRDERERHRYVSFVYQNMEFETEEPIGGLLEYVYANGFHEGRDSGLVAELVEVCELQRVLKRRTQEVSKGELQRTILAFSVLYGSRLLMLDEPIFALEDYQKQRLMEYLLHYCRDRGVSLYYSVHELDISRKYSDHLLLFRKTGPPLLGPTAELFNRETIEEAYQVPFVTLKAREALFRRHLLDRARRDGDARQDPQGWRDTDAQADPGERQDPEAPAGSE